MRPRSRHTRQGIELLKSIARHGFRIFTLETAKSLSKEVGMNESYVSPALTYLRQDGWIYLIKNGLYALDISFLGGVPLHKHEVAMHLVSPAAISHFSALQYHGLIDQIPLVTYISTVSGAKIPRLSRKNDQGLLINGSTYKIIKVQKNAYFGFTERWESNTKIIYTDKEKTLLDGLISPHLCGGFQEVLHVFQTKLDQVDIQKLLNYSQHLPAATSKRLGWVLEKLGVSEEILAPLRTRPIQYCVKLDAHHENVGPYNRQWSLRENL